MQSRSSSLAVRGRVASLLVAVGASMGPAAHADDARRSSTAAEALFVEGRALLRQRRFAEACVKLAQSAQIDPAAGTLLNLAYGYEAAGQTASAWSAYLDAASAAATTGQKARVATAQQKARELEPRLARVRFALPPSLAHEGALDVRRDDARVTPGELETAVPVDPGRHVIEVRLEGYAPWSHTVEVHDGDGTVTVTVPALTRMEAAPAPPAVAATSGTPAAPGVAAGATATAGAHTAASDPGPAASGWRTVGLAAGITGAVAAGVGGYFGLRAIARDGDARRACGAPGPCADGAGVEAGESANRAATASTVLVAAGGALFLSGAALYLFAPRAHTSESRVDVGAAVTPDGVALRAWGIF